MKADFEKYVLMGITVLVIIGVYNTFLKTYTPTFARNFIGMA